MWYFLDYNPETSIFRVIDQTKKLCGNASSVKDEFSDLFYDQPLSNDDQIIDYVEIKPRSIFSDILWDYLFQGEIKIVSERVYEIFCEYNIYNVKAYKTIVKKGGVFKEYYSLRGIGEILEFINYDKSVFYHFERKSSSRTKIAFKNQEEYIYKSKEVGPIDSINPLEIYFVDTFMAKQFDLIPLGYLKPCSFLVSDSLKRKIENENLIGFEFKKCTFILD